MKGFYEAILEVYGEIEQNICKDNNIPFAFDYAKEAVDFVVVTNVII